MELTFDDLVAPVTDLDTDFETASFSWRWLIARPARPVLLRALGDLFLEINDGVYFLDTIAGKLEPAAPSLVEWKLDMRNPERIRDWFLPEFIGELRRKGRPLNAQEVYSPTIPPILGGSMTVENFTPSHWHVHLHVLGQIHEQVRDLPPGTPITKIIVEPW